MIFVTVGTEKFPFDRMIRAIEKAIRNEEIKDKVFAQIGSCGFEPELFPYERFLSFDNMKRFIKKADIITASRYTDRGCKLFCVNSILSSNI